MLSVKAPMDVQHDAPSEAFLRVAEQVPACTLDPGGRAAQARRYRRLARSVLRTSRMEATLVVELSEGFDRENLEELIAVERECCPFFRFSLDDRACRLEVGASSPEGVAALEVVAEGLKAGASSPGS
jgi:hypothetical protein